MKNLKCYGWKSTSEKKGTMRYEVYQHKKILSRQDYRGIHADPYSMGLNQKILLRKNENFWPVVFIWWRVEENREGDFQFPFSVGKVGLTSSEPMQPKDILKEFKYAMKITNAEMELLKERF